MKKSVIRIVFLIICCLSISSCSKESDSIEVPLTSEIISVDVVGDTGKTTHMDEEWIDSFMQKISEAIPTSKESVQDIPNTSKYTRVDILYSDKKTSIFIYEEKSRWYIEQPYQGIYETDKAVLNLLEIKN